MIENSCQGRLWRRIVRQPMLWIYRSTDLSILHMMNSSHLNSTLHRLKPKPNANEHEQCGWIGKSTPSRESLSSWVQQPRAHLHRQSTLLLRRLIRSCVEDNDLCKHRQRWSCNPIEDNIGLINRVQIRPKLCPLIWNQWVWVEWKKEGSPDTLRKNVPSPRNALHTNEILLGWCGSNLFAKDIQLTLSRLLSLELIRIQHNLASGELYHKSLFKFLNRQTMSRQEDGQNGRVASSRNFSDCLKKLMWSSHSTVYRRVGLISMIGMRWPPGRRVRNGFHLVEEDVPLGMVCCRQWSDYDLHNLWYAITTTSHEPRKGLFCLVWFGDIWKLELGFLCHASVQVQDIRMETIKLICCKLCSKNIGLLNLKSPFQSTSNSCPSTHIPLSQSLMLRDDAEPLKKRTKWTGCQALDTGGVDLDWIYDLMLVRRFICYCWWFVLNRNQIEGQTKESLVQTSEFCRWVEGGIPVPLWNTGLDVWFIVCLIWVLWKEANKGRTKRI